MIEEVIETNVIENARTAHALVTIGERLCVHIDEKTDGYAEWQKETTGEHTEPQSIDVTEIVFFEKQDTYVIRFSVVGAESQLLFCSREFIEEHIYLGDFEIIDNVQCGEEYTDYVLVLALRASQ